MAIYIDSAILKEVEAARSLGWVRGVTTNPVLLAKAGGQAQAVLADLAHLAMGLCSTNWSHLPWKACTRKWSSRQKSWDRLWF
jgi:hypothetical protein